MLLQMCVFMLPISSHDEYKYVHTLRAELVHIVWVGQQKVRVNHSQCKVRLRPLSSEIMRKISAQDLVLCLHGNTRNADTCLEFMSTCRIYKFILKTELQIFYLPPSTYLW